MAYASLPLFFSAELHITAVLFAEMPEIVSLHNHIVEFEERQPLFHTLFVAFGAEHIIDRKTRTDFAQKLDIVKV